MASTAGSIAGHRRRPAAMPEWPMTSKHRVAIVGLGMALGPHLRSLEALDRRVGNAARHSPPTAPRGAPPPPPPRPPAGGPPGDPRPPRTRPVFLPSPPPRPPPPG